MRTYFQSCACLCALACLAAGCESGASRQRPLPEPQSGQFLAGTGFSSAEDALKLANSFRSAGAASQARRQDAQCKAGADPGQGAVVR